MTGKLKSICMLIVFLSVTSLSPADIDQLQNDFQQPPDQAKIMMRWWWFGPAVTNTQLEREMTFMKQGGIGGFEVQPTYPLALDNEVSGLVNNKFLSQQHLDAITFTARKAKELGLRMDLTLGSGWPYGGPQFPATEAAGRLLTQNVRIQPGQTSVPLPRARQGQRIFAAFIGPMPNTPAGENPYQEIEIRDNAAQLPPDLTGIRQVTFFIAGQTGMKVKRAANGAEGYVIDHYNPAVVDKFITQMAEPVLKACGPNPPYAVFCDSLEVGGESWTYNLLDEFKKRRGYDLRPWLPALVNNNVPRASEVRHDWGKTLTELFNDYFNTPLQKWARQNKTRFRIQGYGTPPAALYSYAYADLNEGEGYTWKGFRESRWAASASHLLGRPVTSSETWTWLHSPVFMATPLDMKAEADMHFLQGINQLVGHGWPYTAEGIEYPGWRFYAAGVFNEKNPWWIVMPDVAKYFQRVSWIMRQGTPANDVALYLSNSDAWARFAPRSASMNSALSSLLGRNIVSGLLDAGYNFDFFDDGLLDMRGKVQNGTLTFGDVKFKVVVLAGVERIPPSTMRKLEEFVRTGGTLVATRRLPSTAPGLMASEQDQNTIRDTVQRLFLAENAKGIFLQSENNIAQALADRLDPDVAFQPAATDIGFVHRQTESAEVYFLANTANAPKSVNATFRVAGLNPQCWNPITGQITAAQVTGKSPNTVTVAVELEPYGSTILVFSKRPLPAQSAPAMPASVPPAIDLSTGWHVTFTGHQAPAARDIETLGSWTQIEGGQYFSGVASYTKTLTVPNEMLTPGLTVRLDLGPCRTPATRGGRMGRGGGGGGSNMRSGVSLEVPVQDAAVVYLNDQKIAALWCPPYSVDLTGRLKSGQNTLRIEVANRAVNYMAGRPLPNYRQLDAVYGNRFDPQDMNRIRSMPSGLTGPVKLIAAAKTQ